MILGVDSLQFPLYYVCVQACIHVCAYVYECHFSGAATFFFLFEMESLTGLEMAKQARLAGQQAQGSIHL